MPLLSRRIRYGVMATCLLAIGLCVAQAIHFRWRTDDAYITFAYAQNWVQGHGVVFNVGERVEGYTCFLWVALSALGLRLGADIGQWSVALGIISAVIAVVAAWQLAHELLPEPLCAGSVLAAVAAAGYPALGWWAGSGMETALFAALVTLALWLHVRAGARSIAAPLCLALASMTRPEGWLLSALLCLDALRVGSRRDAVRYIGIFLALFGPYYAWRFWYYGEPLPNTFYAKVGYSRDQMLRGINYVREFAGDGRGVYLCVASAAALGLGMARRCAVIYVFLVAYVVYVILVGGDFLQQYRFLMPIVPTLIALSVVAVLGWIGRLASQRTFAAYIAGTLAVVGFLLSCTPMQHRQEALAKTYDDLWLAMNASCQYLTRHTEPDDAIASIGVGILKFCTGRRVIDMLGLTDEHISRHRVASLGRGLAGHERYDSEYVLAQLPKYIAIPVERDFKGLPLEALRDMWAQPLLHSRYAPDPYGYRRVDPPT